MSQKNPYQKLTKLKVLVEEDSEGKEAKRECASELDALRPKTRRDCLPGGSNEMRPCPWYGCKYHLGLDINDNGSMAVRNIDEMVHTCDLDVAEIGGTPGSGKGTGITLEEAGEIMSLTRERMRQIEFRGLIELKPILIARGMAPEDWKRAINRTYGASRPMRAAPTDDAPEPAPLAPVNTETAREIQEVQEIPLDSDGEQD